MLNDNLNFYSNCVSTQPHPHGLLCFFGLKKKKKKKRIAVAKLNLILQDVLITHDTCHLPSCLFVQRSLWVPFDRSTWYTIYKTW